MLKNVPYFPSVKFATSKKLFLGYFHRHDTRKNVSDPFSEEQKQKINELISRLNTILKINGEKLIEL